jgi:Regulator of G protein signaling domain
MSGLYNAFLAPGSPCELNIDHALRNSLAGRMTRAVGDEESMLKSLREVVELFEHAQVSVFKLMSSVSTCLQPCLRRSANFHFRILYRNSSGIRSTPPFCENTRESSA